MRSIFFTSEELIELADKIGVKDKIITKEHLFGSLKSEEDISNLFACVLTSPEAKRLNNDFESIYSYCYFKAIKTPVSFQYISINTKPQVELIFLDALDLFKKIGYEIKERGF